CFLIYIPLTRHIPSRQPTRNGRFTHFVGSVQAGCKVYTIPFLISICTTKCPSHITIPFIAHSKIRLSSFYHLFEIAIVWVDQTTITELITYPLIAWILSVSLSDFKRSEHIQMMIFIKLVVIFQV